MNLITVRPNNRRRYRRVPTFNHWLDNAVKASEVNRTATSRPALNVVETAEDYRMEFAVPGLTKEDLNIHFEDEQLTVAAEKVPADQENEHFLRKEFGAYTFKRTFQLPEDVNADGIQASVQNGILTITLAKKEEAKELPPRKIEVA